jgi:hypothetical protein
MEEIGSDLQQIHRDRDDDLTDALLGLQARASLVLMEIHNALSNGFPHAAWARARSLHETAVIADVLSEHGREPGTIDLATRYLAHAVLDQASDLKLIGGSGGDVDPTFEASVQQTKQELLEQYGEPFARDYGWARPLFPELKPREPVRFARLEMLTGSQLNRLDYRLGGHHVHSSAWTLHLNRVQRGNAFLRLTGPMNRELSGPAVVAINAAIMTTRAVTFGASRKTCLTPVTCWLSQRWRNSRPTPPRCSTKGRGSSTVARHACNVVRGLRSGESSARRRRSASEARS